MSRWLAPEIINPRRGNSAPVMESKPADVFAFAMFSVEVFTGKIPFEEQKNEAVVLRVSLGGRPEMPGNARVVGLTGEMWKLLESCWRQNPRRRPTMEEVVKRWQKFVGHENYDNVVRVNCSDTLNRLLFHSQLFTIHLGNQSLRYVEPCRKLHNLRGRLRPLNSC